ncbi:MAG: hypothetical protein ACTH32_06620 [Microbacterium gubbeenense]
MRTATTTAHGPVTVETFTDRGATLITADGRIVITSRFSRAYAEIKDALA